MEKNISSPHIKENKIWVFIAIIAGFALFTYFANLASNFDPESPGMGQHTFSVNGIYKEKLVGGSVVHIDELITTAKEHQKKGYRIIFVFGASQLYAINELQDDQQPTIVHANLRTSKRGEKNAYIELHEPNSNFNEMLAFLLLVLDSGIKPDGLVIAITYDDLRESGVRNSILSKLANLKPSSFLIKNSSITNLQLLLSSNKQQDKISSISSISSISDTNKDQYTAPQKIVEDQFIIILNKIWPAYRNQNKLRALTEVTWKTTLIKLIYKFKKPSVIRIPEELKKWNMDALDTITKISSDKNIRLFFYKQPYRSGKKGYYLKRNEYDQFHTELEAMCNNNNIVYLDMEHLVPDQYWGLTNLGLPDPFHFMYEGHVKLGNEIDQLLESRGW